MDVRLPNGTVIRGVPDDYTSDQVRSLAIQNKLATGADFGMSSDTAALIPTGGTGMGPTPPKEGMSVEPRTLTQSAIEGAMAVPILAAGARGAQALVRGSRAAPYAAEAARALIPTSGRALVAEGLTGAAAGVGGELVARQVPAEFGTLAQMGGGALGGAIGGGIVGAVRNLTEGLMSAPALFSSTKELANQVTEAAATGRASKQAMTAFAANPALAGNVARAQQIAENTGITLPSLAASNGDTTISSYLQSQIARGENVEFTAALKRQYETAEQALSKAKGKAAPSMEEVDAYVKKKAQEAGQKNLNVLAKAAATTQRRQTGLENINNRITELTDSLRTNEGKVTDIGSRLDNLLDVKERIAKRDMSPKYEQLLKNSEEAGVVFPSELATGLRTYATEEEFKSAFTSFPTLWPKIKRIFANPDTDYSLRDLDSLKRETNAALRETQRGTSEYRIISGLKQEVDAAIDKMDPSFAVPYRALDKEYATRIGIPFNEAGVLQVDRAKFVEQTVPVLTQRASSLKQVMDIIGDSPEGLKIVEDAFLYDIANNRSIINTATGQLNTAQLNRYLSKNKDKLDMVPGLKDRLEGVATRVDELKANHAAILQAEKNAKIEKIENLWTKAYGTTDGLRGVVRRGLDNPQELDALLNVAGKDAVAKEGIKSAMLDDVLNAQGDRLQLFNNSRPAFEKVFGKEHTKYLNDVVEASQRLKDNPFAMRININTISKTGWQDLTGSKMETTLGEARNQIMTAPRVFINHLGRFFSKQSNDIENAQIQKFLLDTKALQEAAQLLNTLNTRGFDERAKSLLGNLMKTSTSSWLFGAITGGLVGSQAEPVRNTYDPALLEGFGQVPQ
jgi:hypothetical protein